MARIKNDLLKLSDSMGGITFIPDDKGTIVKQKSEKPILLSAGTRNSNVEMGGASKAAKSLRLTLSSKKRGYEDHHFSGRLSGKIRMVIGLGDGLPGQRKLDFRRNGDLLEVFEFIEARPLVTSVGGIKEKPYLSDCRTKISWTSPTLTPKKQITAPKEATHIKFILGAGTVSNYKFDKRKKSYIPIESRFKNMSDFVESDPIGLKQKIISPVDLRLHLDASIVLPDEVAVITMVGVSFMQEVNGEMLDIKGLGGMRILGVY